MSVLKLAVWDVDGTLIDSRASIHRAAVESANAIGIEAPSYQQVRQIVGVSLFEALQMLRLDIDPETIAAWSREFQSAFLRFHADPAFREVLYDGAHDALLRLKADGWCLGMATGNSRRGVTRLTEKHGWTELFDATFCADDGPSKPHPHMLHCNMNALGMGAHQTVMIGDTSHDIHMARQAGVQAIGVSWGFHTAEELELAGANTIVHSFDELNAVLDAFEPEVIA